MSACFKVIGKQVNLQTGEVVCEVCASPEIHNVHNDCKFFRWGFFSWLILFVQRHPKKYCKRCFHWRDPLAGCD